MPVSLAAPQRCKVLKNTCDSMSFKTVPISYVYAEPDVWTKYESAITVAGWRKAVILTQIAQTYGKVNLEYYQMLAELDAQARGFKEHQGEHFDLLSNWHELPPYQKSRPEYAPSPLATIPNPDSKLERRSFGQFRCSARNSAILHLAMLWEQSNIQVLMTRMMRWYYDRYWTLYLPQLAAAEQHTMNPTFTTEAIKN